MKIGIDISAMQYAGTGVARYTKAIVEHLVKSDKKNIYTLFYSSFGNIFTSEKLQEDVRKLKNVHLKTFPIPEFVLHSLWNNHQLISVERLIGKQDLFFYSDWLFPPFKGKKITTVHDLVFRKYPETVHPYVLKTQQERFKKIVDQNFFILCDSLATQEDLVNLYPIDIKKTSVVYPGVETKRQTDAEVKKVMEEFHLNKPFILAVGKKEPRKNLPRLIEAFNNLHQDKVELVIVGPSGWEEVSSQKGVRILPFVPDAQLYALYQSALFFVMPSLYEGFGFPLVEAMSLGCPTACSNNSSLREIGKNASHLFDPSQVSSITAALKKMISDEKLRKILVTCGFEQAKQFSWDKTAERVLEIIEKQI